MRFHKNVPQELQEILSVEYNRYTKEVSMTAEERNELKKWVQSGNSPYDNGWYIATEAGGPMDFVNALRFFETETSVDVIYDTVADDIVFVAGKGTSADPLTEDLPF